MYAETYETLSKWTLFMRYIVMSIVRENNPSKEKLGSPNAQGCEIQAKLIAICTIIVYYITSRALNAWHGVSICVHSKENNWRERS